MSSAQPTERHCENCGRELVRKRSDFDIWRAAVEEKGPRGRPERVEELRDRLMAGRAYNESIGGSA